MIFDTIKPIIVAFLWVYPLFSIVKRLILNQGKPLFVLKKRIKWVMIDTFFSAVCLYCTLYFARLVYIAYYMASPLNRATWMLLIGGTIFFSYFTAMLGPWKRTFVVTDRGIQSPLLSVLRDKLLAYQWFDTQKQGNYLLMFSVRCIGLITINMPLMGFTIDGKTKKEIDKALSELKIEKKV